MRACKNPPPFTVENLLSVLKPGRGYSIEVIALKFAVPADAARAMVLGAVMLGAMQESKARRGMRVTYWVPECEPRNVAMPRVGPLVVWKPLTGYTAWLLGFRDLCLASPCRS